MKLSCIRNVSKHHFIISTKWLVPSRCFSNKRKNKLTVLVFSWLSSIQLSVKEKIIITCPMAWPGSWFENIRRIAFDLPLFFFWEKKVVLISCLHLNLTKNYIKFDWFGYNHVSSHDIRFIFFFFFKGTCNLLNILILQKNTGN